jgi:glutathionyl-hydroquinone reductase
MELDIEKYLSHEELKEICIKHFKELLTKGGERLLTNIAYYQTFATVDACLDEESKTLVKNKTKEIISNLSNYSVFRRKDVFEQDDSEAYKILQETVRDNKELISNNVLEAINNFNYPKELEGTDKFSEILLEALKKGLVK